MALLEVKGLTKHFGGLIAFNSLDPCIEKGEIVGLIGPNGAGKTTVFNMIMGTYSANKGQVIFKGKDITGQKSHSIVSRGLVRSFQRTILFSEMTVLQNIILGLHLISEIRFWDSLINASSTRNRQKQLLEKAGEIADFMGLGHSKDRLAKNLPHGHQRMLGVAIALATNPELMLIDEPVIGMNIQETDYMMNKERHLHAQGIVSFVYNPEAKRQAYLLTDFKRKPFHRSEKGPRKILEIFFVKKRS
jgi:ABC-type branched-subunit amino acid transport system ATPase component